MTQLRGGIVGCGFFAQFQIEAWRRMPDVDLAAAADPDLARAAAAAQRCYPSIEEMLDAERLDFVDIATRPDSHLALVRAAVSRGVAVICQKPLAPSWEESLEIVRIVEESGVPFMVHENWRWQPWYREVKRRIAAGEIGAPVAYCFRLRQRDGLGTAPYASQPYFACMPRLLIQETLIHPIDTARFLFGDATHCWAETRRVNGVIAGEDMALVTLSHWGGVLGSIDGHRFAHAGFERPVEVSPPMGVAWFEGESAALAVAATGDVLLQGEIVWRNEVARGYRGDSAFATQRHFIDELRGARRFETGGREYLKSVAVVEAAYRSAASGSRVAL
jgi:predicted dehydrogenase